MREKQTHSNQKAKRLLERNAVEVKLAMGPRTRLRIRTYKRDAGKE